MKRFYKFLMPLVAIVAMALPWNVQAQLTTLVADGTSTNSYIPIYGLWADDYTRSQFIYPASMLEDLTPGSQISSLTFYSTTATQDWGAATFDVKLGEVTQTTLSGSYLTYPATTVYSGALTVSSSQMTITFTTPYVYQGGNLMVELFQTVTGTYHSVYFNGVSATGASASGYSSSGASSASFNQRDFLAKMQIEYVPGSGDVCYRVRDIEVSAITSDGFTLTWSDTLNGGATYIIYDMSDTSVLASTSSTTYTFSGLDANTLYNIAVVADCGTSTSSYNVISVRTACGGYTSVPYSTNFDDVTDGEVPPCWLAVMTGSSGSGTFPSVYNYSTNSYSSPKYFEFESNNGATELVALPSMENISQLALSFYASLQNHNFVLEVGVLDDTTFEVVDTINLVTSSNWHDGYMPYTVYFANYTGSGDRIALRVTASGSYTLMMDDFEVFEFSGCYPVSDLTARNIDSSSITLAWEDEYNSGATYTVTYWTAAGDTLVEYATDTTVTITNLGANTMYYVSVEAVCGSGAATAATGNWRTECGSTAIPYVEDFESYQTTVPPPCWEQLSGNPRVQTSYPHTGSKHLYFSGGQPNTIALPPMNQPTGTLQVRFWTRPESYTSSSCGSFSVGYMTDINVDSTFVELANWAYNTFSAYEEKEVPMVGAPDTARIVLRHNSGSTAWYWYVDDLTVEPIPACNRPISVSASNVTSDGADIAILGTSDAYRVYYTTGSTTDSVDVYDSVYTFTTLDASTNYTIAVAAICDDGSITGTVSTSFRTLCGAGGCQVTIAMTDSYGDGWNGAAIYGYANGDQVFSATISSGSTGSFTYSHCATDTLVLRWHTGSYDSETGFSVALGGIPFVSGAGNNYSNNDLIGQSIGCPSCGAPYDIVVSGVTATDAIVSWNTGGGSNFRIYIFDGTDTDSVDVFGDSTYTFTTLNPSTTYTLTMATICDDGSINVANPVTFTTACAAGGCEVVISMTDSFGDGWNGNAINGYINGNSASVFSATLSEGSAGSFSYSLCAVDTLLLTWVTGSYSDEADFVVTVGGSIFGSGNGDDYSTGDTVAFTIGCPSCSSPSNFMATNITTDSATISWTPAGSATEWLVTVNGTTTATTTTSMVLSGLSASTAYTVEIRSICDVDDTSMALIGSFRTACGAISLPFSEDFESIALNTAPPCWDIVTGEPYVNNYTPHSGNKHLYFTGSYAYEAIALPATVLPTGTLQVRLWTRPEGNTYASCGTFSVGYMTNLNVDSTYVELANWSYSDWATNDYEEKEVPMVGAPDSARIVLRHNGNGGYYYWFVDDVEIELMPDCPRPGILNATSVFHDQIDVEFHGSTSGDYIVYITDGASYNDSASVTADSTYSFTGLTPLTTYTISVAADCGTAVSPVRSINVTTTMVAAALPVNTGFEVGQDTSWMFINGSQTNQWVIGDAANNGGSRALYISNDNGVSNSYDISSTSNVFVTKLLAFDTVGDYAIGYDWRANGESCCDYLRVFLVPGSVEFTAGNAGSISSTGAPSGWIALDGGNKLNSSSSWQSYTETFTLANPGNYNLVFFWHNDGSIGSAPAGAIDNVQLSLLSCSQPQNIVVDNVTDISATISWTPGGSESEWAVTCNGATTIVSTPSATVNGLDAATNYTVQVRAICGAGDTSFAATTIFTTDMCSNATLAMNWDTTSSSTTSSYSPMGYSFYNYSYVQTIIDSADMANISGDITAMAFYTASASAGSYFNHMDIYMANVSESDLSAGFIHPDANHTFVQVLSDADLSYSTTGEQLVSFDSTFTWDGHSNVLIAVNRQHGSYSSGSSFNAHTASASKSRYIYQDGSAYDINTVSNGTATSTVGNIKLISCGASTCHAPEIDTVIAGETTATINWTGRGSTFEVAAVAGNWAEPSAPVTVTGTTATLSGLIPGTFYSVGVRAVCDEGVYSEWVVNTVTTIEHPCLTPSNVNAISTTLDGAIIGWTPGEEGQTDFQLRISAAGDTTVVDANTNPFTVTGLLHQTTYSVAVRAVCGTGNYSDWSAPATFTTASCQPVSGVTLTGKTETTATISWSAGSNSNGNYEVEYGYEGFTQGNGTRVPVTGTTYTLQGLDAGTSYDVYVRSQCAEGVYSDWSSRTNFTTDDQIGINDVDDARISLFPNPASSTVTLTGIEGASTVTVVDMNGRVVVSVANGTPGKWKVESGKLTIDVSQLSQGAYFVRITGDRLNAIRKLIVR